MISNSRIKLNNVSSITVLVILMLFSAASLASAQNSMTLSISPSLYDISIEPGQEWRSTLRIINVNKYDLTVYIDVVNFLPQGEGGDGRFVPIPTEGGEGVTLAEWFKIERAPIVIPREQSKEVPLSVTVPFEASPGGHFAAILVGTKPLVAEPGQAKVQTSQMITSLFFARVAGDIYENGSIREFTTDGTFLSSPEVTFNMRFENKGNVHLQPQGDIRIKNMWGQERGIIPINQASQFGNVLPESIRKFTFTWKGEWSVSDIGRYTADATLAYGTNERQFASAKTVFWVIPFKLLFGITIFIALFIFIVTWLVRIYVRHMLRLAGLNVFDAKQRTLNRHEDLSVVGKPKITAPVEAGLLDLKENMKATVSWTEQIKVILSFIIRYRLFFLGILLIGIFLSIIIWYFTNANTDQRSYEITYVNSDASITLSSEEIFYQQKVSERQLGNFVIDKNLPKLKVVNRSGIPGLGAEVKLRLQSSGYEIIELTADSTAPDSRTVIIYHPKKIDAALRLSGLLNKALPSSSDTALETDAIVIFVGSDIENN